MGQRKLNSKGGFKALGMMNIKLQIAKEAAEIKLNDMTGTLSINAALKQAQRNLNRIDALQQIINELSGENDETEIHAAREEIRNQ